jgi:hypothetical protein
MRTIRTQNDGITLLITLLVMGVLLALSSSILNITLRQYQISGTGYSSEIAFQAAHAGMECALYYDTAMPPNGDKFDIGASPDSINCFGVNRNTNPPSSSGEEQEFDFDWGTPAVCTEFSVYKFFDAGSDIPMSSVGINRDCPMGSTCTVIKSRGYNVACGNTDSFRVVERELTLVY